MHRRGAALQGQSVYCWDEDCNLAWVADGMRGERDGGSARLGSGPTGWELLEERVLWA